MIVQRAGDVIPQVVGPAGAHAQGTSEFRMPERCPLCDTEVVKPEGEAMHRCPNRACPSRGLETLINWVRRAMDIEGVGEQFVRRLWDAGPAALDARPLPADGGAAAGARRLRARSRRATRSTAIERVEGSSRSRACSSGSTSREVGWVTGAEPRAALRRPSTGCSTRRRRRSRRSTASGPTAPRRSPSGSPTSSNRALVARAARARPPLRGRRGGAARRRAR